MHRRMSRNLVFTACLAVVSLLVGIRFAMLENVQLVSMERIPGVQGAHYLYVEDVRDEFFRHTTNRPSFAVVWRSEDFPAYLCQEYGEPDMILGHRISPERGEGRVYALQPDFSLREITLPPGSPGLIRVLAADAHINSTLLSAALSPGEKQVLQAIPLVAFGLSQPPAGTEAKPVCLRCGSTNVIPRGEFGAREDEPGRAVTIARGATGTRERLICVDCQCEMLGPDTSTEAPKKR